MIAGITNLTKGKAVKYSVKQELLSTVTKQLKGQISSAIVQLLTELKRQQKLQLMICEAQGIT